MFRKLIFSSKIFPANLIHRNYVRKGRPANPGIERRLEIFSNDLVKDDPEVFENAESDFMRAHVAHKNFEKEEKDYQEKLKLWITRDKYFKKKSPNFLTWAEKEQIRHLHESDREEWNFEQLAESFPATPDIIEKVIKSKWYPKDQKRIEKHDLSVKLAWQQFNADIDPMLKDHLKKFAGREVNMENLPKYERKPLYELQTLSTTEFSSIITSCEKKTKQISAPKREPDLQLPEKPPKDGKDSFLINTDEQFTKKPMTFQEFQRLNEGNEDSPEIVLESTKVDQPSSDLKMLHKIKTDAISLDLYKTGNEKVWRSLEIKEHIKIPKKLWKKGKLYKVDDCFYDDDGEFLYRVPGLT